MGHAVDEIRIRQRQNERLVRMNATGPAFAAAWFPHVAAPDATSTARPHSGRRPPSGAIQSRLGNTGSHARCARPDAIEHERLDPTELTSLGHTAPTAFAISTPRPGLNSASSSEREDSRPTRTAVCVMTGRAEPPRPGVARTRRSPTDRLDTYPARTRAVLSTAPKQAREVALRCASPSPHAELSALLESVMP
jgi:hypothetical protein